MSNDELNILQTEKQTIHCIYCQFRCLYISNRQQLFILLYTPTHLALQALPDLVLSVTVTFSTHLVLRRVYLTGGNRSGLTGYRSNRSGSGLGRYQTGPNSKFKFKFKKFLKILQGATNLMVSNFLKNSFI